jgi:hypothetical protein
MSNPIYFTIRKNAAFRSIDLFVSHDRAEVDCDKPECLSKRKFFDDALSYRKAIQASQSWRRELLREHKAVEIS